MNKIADFKGLYPVAKTLRFRLIPQGKTAENFAKSGVLERDEHRSSSYSRAKQLIDDYHRAIIDEVLASFSFPVDREKSDLRLYYDCYINDNSDSRSSKIQSLRTILRKQVADSFANNDRFKNLNKKELITQDLPEFIKKSELYSADEKLEYLNTIAEFKSFTTYFTGFNENRANMYTAEEKASSIAYRVVNDNLPKFIDNMNSFSKLESVDALKENLGQLYSDMKDLFDSASYPNVSSIKDLFALDFYNNVLTQRQIEVYNAVIGGRVAEGEKAKIKGLNE